MQLQDEFGKLQNEADRLGKEIVELANENLKIIWNIDKELALKI